MLEKLINLYKKAFPVKMIDFPKNYEWIFNSDGSLNTKNLERCQQFAALKETKQSTVWHKEGNVWNHTMLVYKEMCELLKSYRDVFTQRDMIVMKLAALCHDLGKATTTYWDEKEQNWKCNSHGAAGEKITRELLYAMEDVDMREEICWLVRWHMEFHHLLMKPHNKQVDILTRLSKGNSSIEKLLILNFADSLGSHSEEKFDKDERLKIRTLATNLGVYLKPTSDGAVRETDDFTMYVMIGVPGSGKDTLIKTDTTFAGLPVICRDDIREEIKDGNVTGERKLMLDNNGEKRVTQIVNDRIIECCKNKQSFIINQTNMKRKYRTEFISLARQYANPKIEYVLVEAPTIQDCITRRGGGKWTDIITRMIESFEYPTADEGYDAFTIEKQTSSY